MACSLRTGLGRAIKNHRKDVLIMDKILKVCLLGTSLENINFGWRSFNSDSIKSILSNSHIYIN